MEPVITSKQNNLVKYVRGLREKRNRDRDKVFVIEGVKILREAISAGFSPATIIISERGEKQVSVREILSRSGGLPRIVRVSDAVMEYMCETETPQGIMALMKMPDVSLRDIKVNPSSILVVIDQVQDPGNVGTIIRAADAFGVRAVLLTAGCADLYNGKTLRSTMGSVFHLPVLRDVEISRLTAFLEENRIFTAVTAVDETALFLDEVNLKRPLALIFGSEARGVSPDLGRAADVKLKIPMPGLAESLNVAVAAGIVLYEALRQCGSDTKTNL